MISQRIQKLLDSPSKIGEIHTQCQQDKFHSQKNPQGYLSFGTAENHLVWDLISPKLNSIPAILEGDAHYCPSYGLPIFREALAKFLMRTFKAPIDAEQLVIANGATTILDMVGYIFCEPNEGIIIPAPYYPGFDIDLKGRAEVIPLPALTQSADGFQITRDCLDAALKSARERGIRVKALLWSSPYNPLGRVLKSSEIETLLDFAHKNELHCIADEIYANSVFGKTSFTSTLAWRDRYTDFAKFVHIVYGLAKDFTLAGLRVGIFYSRNQEILRAMRGLSYFNNISSLTQRVMTHMLNDETWVDDFLAESAKRLRAASTNAQQQFQALGVKFAPSEAGVFVWGDFRSLLPETSWDGEKALHAKILNKAKVNIMPGNFFHCAEPGWFRICFAQDPENFRQAVERLRKVL